MTKTSQMLWPSLSQLVSVGFLYQILGFWTTTACNETPYTQGSTRQSKPLVETSVFNRLKAGFWEELILLQAMG